MKSRKGIFVSPFFIEIQWKNFGECFSFSQAWRIKRKYLRSDAVLGPSELPVNRPLRRCAQQAATMGRKVFSNPRQLHSGCLTEIGIEECNWDNNSFSIDLRVSPFNLFTSIWIALGQWEWNVKNRFIKASKTLVVIVPFTAVKGERRKKAIRREITNLSHLQWIKEKRKLLKIKKKNKKFYCHGTQRTTACDWRQFFDCLFHTQTLFASHGDGSSSIVPDLFRAIIDVQPLEGCSMLGKYQLNWHRSEIWLFDAADLECWGEKFVQAGKFIYFNKFL